MILSIKERRQKPRRAPTGLYKRLCRSKVRRRRRNVALENFSKEMLRYLDNSEDVEGGYHRIARTIGGAGTNRYSIQQEAEQARNENGQKVFEICWQEREELCIASWARCDAQWKGLVELERRCQDISREKMICKRQENFRNAIEGKLRVQGWASERLQDQNIEQIKELEHTKTEETLQIAVKEHDLWMYQNEKEEAKRLQGVTCAPPRKFDDMA